MKPVCKLILFSLLIVLNSTLIHAQVTAIKAGRLLDPETGSVSANQIILVEGQTIKAIGPDVQIPTGASIIDLSNRTVLPGLFDAHTHLCMTTRRDRHAGNYFYTTLSDSNAYRAIQGVANARSMLETGFTTIRDVGNSGNYPRRSLSEFRFVRSASSKEYLSAWAVQRELSIQSGRQSIQPDKSLQSP